MIHVLSMLRRIRQLEKTKIEKQREKALRKHSWTHA
jgi:hypothetical protein